MQNTLLTTTANAKFAANDFYVSSRSKAIHTYPHMFMREFADCDYYIRLNMFHYTYSNISRHLCLSKFQIKIYLFLKSVVKRTQYLFATLRWSEIIIQVDNNVKCGIL